MKYIKCIYSSKSITRPKDVHQKQDMGCTIGAWVENGFNTNEHELLQFIEKIWLNAFIFNSLNITMNVTKW